jgi:hypothetical protein
MITYLLLIEDVFTVHCCKPQKINFEKDYEVKVLREFPKESDIDVRKWHCGFKCVKSPKK